MEKAVLVISCTTTFSQNYTINFAAEMEAATGIESQPIYAFSLHEAYPNPFNPSTTISFNLSRPGYTTVKVFNAAGQKVDDLFTGNLQAGEKQILWKPSGISGGIYFIAVTTPQGTKTNESSFVKII